jgi:hypothetical protein
MTSPTHCPREKDVNRAGNAGRLDPELAAHVADCPVCRDAWLVARGMEHLPAGPADFRMLPDASVIWRRAELRRIDLLRRKALAPVILYRRAAWLAVGVAAALLALLYGSTLQELFMNVAPRWYSSLASGAPSVEWKLLLDISLASAGVMVSLGLFTWLCCLVMDRHRARRPGRQPG